MASYETRVLPSGEVRHRVRFRHAGANKALTFSSDVKALSFKSAVELLGSERALALLDEPSGGTGPVLRTVYQQVLHHVEHLTDVTDGTRAKYRKIAAGRLRDPFETVLLADLTRDMVAAWMIRQKGAPKTIRNAHALLSAAISSAVRDELIPNNPAKGVRPPKRDAEAGEHVYLTHDEFATLLRLVPARWQLFPMFLVGTGVRFSEATALTVAALDLEHGSARINQAWKDNSGGPWVLGPPKTAKSRRTIAIPPQLVTALRDHTDGMTPGDFVFTNTRGNPIRNGVFHESVWQPLMWTRDDEGIRFPGPFQKATGKHLRVHDLRHTYASWAIRAGIPLPVIQRQMGHESIQTTVDTYGHLVRSDLDALAVTIGASLPQIGS